MRGERVVVPAAAAAAAVGVASRGPPLGEGLEGGAAEGDKEGQRRRGQAPEEEGLFLPDGRGLRSRALLARVAAGRC